MTLDRIAQHIKDIEAITQYERVRKDRDTLVAELSKARRDFKGRIGALTSQNQILDSELRRTQKELHIRNATLDDKEKELKTKNQAIEQASLVSASQKARIKDLDNLRLVADGKTLIEVEKDVFKAKDQEIGRRAQQISSVIVENWRSHDKQRGGKRGRPATGHSHRLTGARALVH